MAFKCIAFLISCFLLKYCICGEKAKGKYLQPFSEEAYKTLLLLVQRKFNVLLAERNVHANKRMPSCVIGEIVIASSLGPQATPTLYFDDKKVVKKSAISGLVSRTFDDAKSGGCKKLRNRAAAGFVGLSERNILRETNSQIQSRIHNVKFTNKATPRPVTTKSVQAQHQVDLMDLSKDAVEHDGRV